MIDHVLVGQQLNATGGNTWFRRRVAAVLGLMLVVGFISSVFSTSAAHADGDRQPPVVQCNPFVDDECTVDPVAYCEDADLEDPDFADCGMTEAEYGDVRAALQAIPDVVEEGDAETGFTYTYVDDNGDPEVMVLGPTVFDVGQESATKLGVTADGCGFMKLCLYFNHTAQVYLGSVSVGIAALAICESTGPIGCGVATAVAIAAGIYIGDHGLCPGSRKLRIQIFPHVGSTTCVS